MRRFITAALLLTLTGTFTRAESMENYITRRGHQLMDGEQPFRFISYNIPCLHYNEDNLQFDETNAWRLPDEFEIRDALGSIAQMGGTATRCYTLSVRKPRESRDVPRHVLGPGQFDEDAFRALDKVLQVAHETGVRVIVPFVDNWIWWGGRAEYAAFRGKGKGDFWSDPQLIGDFKKTIHFVINRTNTFTGTKYKNDKAILAWETGNELESPYAWTKEIVRYIKQLDQNHLVIDGFHSSIVRDQSLEDPEIDIVTTHHYPQNAAQLYQQLRENVEKVGTRKPYFVGEFGFVETEAVATFLDMLMESGTSGALVWSLRYHNRDGGFYWHSEPFGGDRYKAYHWPGFAAGSDYDETNLMRIMRQRAYGIRGLEAPEVPTPAAPRLLPIEDVSAISWQGSVGAAAYDVQRAHAEEGPWKTVGQNVSDAAVQYRPLFADATAPRGEFLYRVIAKNDAGMSAPSNIVGPVNVTESVLVDEMADLSLTYEHTGAIALRTKNTRKAKEDIHRLEGDASTSITYRLPRALVAAHLYTFFPSGVQDFCFLVSADGREFSRVEAKKEGHYVGEGDYGYWKPVRYEVESEANDATYLRIEFATTAQISRIEIRYRNE